MTDIMALPPQMLTVSTDTAQLRQSINDARSAYLKGDGSLSSGDLLRLIDRLLGIVERMEDRQFSR